MVCQTFRKAFSLHLSLTLVLCLALVAPLLATSPDWSDEASASVILRAPDAPLAVLAITPTVRTEKRPPSSRLALQKRDRITRLVQLRPARTSQSRPLARQLSRNLPRRLLSLRQTTSRSSDEPSPLLIS